MDAIEFRDVLWKYFRYLRICMDTIFRPIVEAAGLTMLQARILVEIQAVGAITVSELGEAIGTGTGNISTMCKRLEQMGCVRRERAAADERVVFVSLTPEGSALLAEIEREIARRCGSVLSRWPEEDIAQIRAGAVKIKELLDALQAQNNAEGVETDGRKA